MAMKIVPAPPRLSMCVFALLARLGLPIAPLEKENRERRPGRRRWIRLPCTLTANGLRHRSMTASVCMLAIASRAQPLSRNTALRQWCQQILWHVLTSSTISFYAPAPPPLPPGEGRGEGRYAPCDCVGRAAQFNGPLPCAHTVAPGGHKVYDTGALYGLRPHTP